MLGLFWVQLPPSLRQYLSRVVPSSETAAFCPTIKHDYKIKCSARSAKLKRASLLNFVGKSSLIGS